MIQNNSDLPDRLTALLTTHTAEWVAEQQPTDWRSQTWKTSWQEYSLPCPHVLDELDHEMAEHHKIRRKFIFSTYHDRPALELFIAVMAWGSGTDGRALYRIRTILTQPRASQALQAVVDTVRRDGAAAGYKAYYQHNKLEQLNVAFVTKLLYFAGYQTEQPPRPLIYDKRVSTAVTRLPTAPLLPATDDRIRATHYRRYCEWASALATEHQTEPAVVEWALFTLGDEIREALRA